MAPTPISVVQAAKSTPAKYTFAGGSEVLLESAYAEFDGSAAGASWLPSLAVYSPSGVLLGRGFPADAVAAGDSAQVTFAPFPVAGATAAPVSSASLPVAHFTSDPLTSNPAGGYGIANASWVSLATNDATCFALTGTGIDAAQVLKTGTYEVQIEQHFFGAATSFVGAIRIQALGINNLGATQGWMTIGQSDMYLPTGATDYRLTEFAAIQTLQVSPASHLPWHFRGRILATADTWTGTVVMVMTRLGDVLV